MAVSVRVPTALRKLAAGNDVLTVDASDVAGVFVAVRAAYPDLAAQVIDDQGKVRRFVNIFANDEDIRFLDDLATPVKDGDEVSIVPAIAGGCCA